jgi:hypothetical protein
MEFINEVIPTALRRAVVAPTLGGSAAGVCPQTGIRRVDAHTQVACWAAAANAAMATGHRPWSSLIT